MPRKNLVLFLSNQLRRKTAAFIKLIILCALTNSIFITSTHAQSKDSGTVLMALGDVKINRGGQLSVLKKGGIVQSGDAILTGVTSNAQVRMSDGAIIAVRPESEFKITEYSFNGKADGSEKASLSLVKGGVRAVTGVIGRENRDNLKVDAVVATVGIRGTGFNIVYCQGSCVNSDRSIAKNGLYANVFEGKVVVANDAKNGVYGQNEPIYVENKTSTIERLKEVPVFLKDALTGQVNVPKKADSLVVPVLAPVNVPTESASSVPSATASVSTNSGVVTTVPPSITSDTASFVPTTYYNKPGMGQGSPVAASTTGAYFLQLSEIYPNSTSPTDGLPFHNVTPANNAKTSPGIYIVPGYWGVTTTGTTTADYPNKFTLYSSSTSTTPATVRSVMSDGSTATPGAVNDIYALNINPATGASTTGTQVEGGTYNGIVSWGRWGGTVAQVAGYNQGNPITYDAQSGFSYVVGAVTTPDEWTALRAPSTPSSLSFTLMGATSPSSVTPVSGTSWYVTSGNLTANLVNSTINGNLAMTTNQTAGYGLYNMTFAGNLGSGASNAVSTSLSKTAGSLGTCATTCTGTGNVSFYGANAAAAGLAYDVNTGVNVIQGVAVFKKN